jgi:uroporphyrinogen decarboxylase
MQRLGSDGRALTLGAPVSALRRDVSATCVVDDWGLTWQQAPGSLYFEVTEPPLRNLTVSDLDHYPWPDMAAPSRFAGLADQARAIQAAGYAVVLVSGITLFEHACLMRGLDTYLMDLAADEDFFTALLVKIKSLALPCVREMLRVVGPYADIITTGDDLGMQGGPLLSPRDYRRLVKPHEAELIAAIKQHSRAKVFFHSCGNVYPLVGDLIDIGVDLINPVQVSAGELGDTARLKREFGARLAFNGAVDTRWALPHGTPDDVRREVRRRIKDLAPGGGYICSAVHCLQPDVPPANIVAMCEEVQTAGQYPLRV